MKYSKVFLLFFTVLGMTSCIKEEEPNIEVDILKVLYGDTEGILNVLFTPSGVDIYADATRVDASNVSFSFILSDGAKITPNPLEVSDYSAPQVFTVVSEDGAWSKRYEVRVIFPEMPTEFDFEHWLQPEGEKYKLPYEVTATDQLMNELYIWACGNDPFAFTVGKEGDYTSFPTQPTEESFEGQYAAKLVTKNTGDYYKPIAAGNLFIGNFDSSRYDPLESTHFGLPFTSKPLRLTGMYKYRSGGQTLKTMVDDRCKIEGVLYRTDKDVTHLNGYTIKNSPNIVARTKMSYGGDTAGDGYVPFDLEFVYTQDIDAEVLKRGGYNLAIIFSASQNGDTYDGAIGSVLMVDNVRVITDNQNL